MGIDKKKLLIIAVVAVVAYFLIKKWKESQAKMVTTTNPETGLRETLTLKFDANTYKSLVNQYCSAADPDFKTDMVKMCAGIYNSAKNNTNYTYENVKKKADDNDFTYDQQIFCEALWQMAVEKESTYFLGKPAGSGKAYFETVVEKMRGW